MPIEKTSPTGLLSQPPARRPINPQNFQRVSPGVYQNQNGRTFTPRGGVMPPPRQIPPGVQTGGPLRADQMNPMERQAYRQAARIANQRGIGSQQGEGASGSQGPWSQPGMMPSDPYSYFGGSPDPGYAGSGNQGPWQNIPMPYYQPDSAGFPPGGPMVPQTGGPLMQQDPSQGFEQQSRYLGDYYPGQQKPNFVGGWSQQFRGPMGMNRYADETRRRAFNQRGIQQPPSPISQMKVVP